jgi:hypothetical protein
VRQQEGILERQISRIQARFAFECIQSRRRHLTAPKSSDEILIHYHSASRGIDHDRTVRQARNGLGIEEMVRLLCLRCMQAQKRTDSKQILRVIVEYRILFYFGRQVIRIEVVDFHPEPASAFSDRLADPAHTEDTENLSSHLPSK